MRRRGFTTEDTENAEGAKKNKADPSAACRKKRDTSIGMTNLGQGQKAQAEACATGGPAGWKPALRVGDMSLETWWKTGLCGARGLV